MIETGARLFNGLTIAIGVNPAKRPTFALADRIEMLRASTRHLRGVRISSFGNQYLIDYAREIGSTHILRGIRSQTDYEYERVMRHINSDLDSGITTVFLMPPRDIAEVSSSMVRSLIGPKGWEDTVRRYVPDPVFQMIAARAEGDRARDLKIMQ